jgi:hypothetical protein
LHPPLSEPRSSTSAPPRASRRRRFTVHGRISTMGVRHFISLACAASRVGTTDAWVHVTSLLRFLVGVPTSVQETWRADGSTHGRFQSVVCERERERGERACAEWERCSCLRANDEAQAIIRSRRLIFTGMRAVLEPLSHRLGCVCRHSEEIQAEITEIFQSKIPHFPSKN